MSSNTQKLEHLLVAVTKSSDFAESLKSQLVDLVDSQNAKIAHIQSATKLSTVQMAEIQTAIPASNYDFSINSNLIGGLKITLGDQIFDYSLSAKLEAITSQL